MHFPLSFNRQTACNRVGRCLFAAHVQMGINVGSGRKIAVTKPKLDLLETDPIGQKQAGAAVPKLVEAENEGILVEVENGT